MGFKCGIVGLPNVGKSTLFNALTASKNAEAANFPFCTIEPNVGVVNVPDLRLQKLAKLVNPQKVIPATVEIVDIAGLVKGASKGEGLGNQFLANIRETDAIIHVLRCFDDENISHVDGSVDPKRDKETIDIELQLKDLETIENRLNKVGRSARSGNKDSIKENNILMQIRETLQQSKNVRIMDINEKDRIEYVQPLQLITDKPVLYVCNVDEASASQGNNYVEIVKEFANSEKTNFLFLAVNIEADINELESFEERLLFLEDLGLKEAGASKLIRSAYNLLNRQTYFTAGEKEVRAWTIPIGASAPDAAGEIHTDFKSGFIKAEVISFSDYIQYGSEIKVKEAGKVRVEGKEYLVKDGDIIHFRFNV